MRRWLLPLVLAGCEVPAEPDAPIVHTVGVPAPSAWPLGSIHGRIGRSVAPQHATRISIEGAFDRALRTPAVWPVAGEARAIVFGFDREHPAVELIDLDRHRIVWRDTTQCTGPVVGVAGGAVICADATGTRALAVADGKPLWRSDATFATMTDDRVVTAAAGEVSIRHARDGGELAKVALPAGVTAEQLVASCGDDGRELYAAHDGTLARLAGAKIAWSVAVGNVAGIDACTAPTAIVTVASELGTSLVAIARDTGKPTGRVDHVRGDWPARDGSNRIEISTPGGIARWPRDLSSGESDAELARLPPLDELLAHDAHHWLVRATARTAAVLDDKGVRAYVPLAERGAVLGPTTILAGSWIGAPGLTARLVEIPPAWRRPLRIPGVHAAVTIPAELRDLPGSTPLDLTHAIARAGSAMYAVTAVAVDARAVYASTLEHAADDTSHPGLARFELATQTWSWMRADGCGVGAPVGIAIAGDVIACAAQASKAATVRATTREGTASWEWSSDHVDAIEAAGDVVIVHDADRLVVLDAHDGHVLDRIASDDGAAVRAAALDVDGMTMVATYEDGRVIDRLPRVAMVPAWSIAIDGVVTAVAAAGDGVLVSLEDGDAYRIDARTGAVVAIAGLDLVWRTSGELVTGEAPGGPVPPSTVPQPPAKPEVYKPTDLEAAPAIATPWPPPPPMRDSWQYTLYDAPGGVRARNDYALEPPIVPAAARGRGAPLVIASTPRMHELLVIDPEHGDPLRRVTLPDDAPTGVAFSAIVDGRPVTGTILAAPLRVVLF